MHHENFSQPLRDLIENSIREGCPPEVLIQELQSEARLLRQERVDDPEVEQYPWPMIARGYFGSPGWAVGPARRVSVDEHSKYNPPPGSAPEISEVDVGEIVVIPEFGPWMWEHTENAAGLLMYDEESPTRAGPTLARQHDMPAVVDCSSIASRVATGDIIALNGQTGEVFRLMLRRQCQEMPQYD